MISLPWILKFLSLDAYTAFHPLRVLRENTKFYSKSQPATMRTEHILSSTSCPAGWGLSPVVMPFLTWGHRASSWLADMRTNFTPSSLLEMEQAKLATCVRGGRKQNKTVRIGLFPSVENCYLIPTVISNPL